MIFDLFNKSTIDIYKEPMLTFFLNNKLISWLPTVQFYLAIWLFNQMENICHLEITQTLCLLIKEKEEKFKKAE